MGLDEGGMGEERQGEANTFGIAGTAMPGTKCFARVK